MDGHHPTTAPGHLHRPLSGRARDDGAGDTMPLKHIALFVAVTVLPIVPALVLLLDPGLTGGVEALTYAGVFVVNLLLTAPVMPIPGASALGQAIIIRQAAAREYPWLVGLAGGLAMGLGEIVPYFVGSLGQRVTHSYESKIPDWIKRWGDRLATPLRWLMHRFPEATLFVLSAVPNPVYEVAGLTAGSMRLTFARFAVPSITGKIVRGLLLAYLGTQLPFA